MRRLVKLGLSSKLVWQLWRMRILTRLPKDGKGINVLRLISSLLLRNYHSPTSPRIPTAGMATPSSQKETDIFKILSLFSLFNFHMPNSLNTSSLYISKIIMLPWIVVSVTKFLRNCYCQEYLRHPHPIPGPDQLVQQKLHSYSLY